MNPDSGVFTCPVGGTYMFMVHLATHKDKKALLSLRKNGMDIASIINGGVLRACYSCGACSTGIYCSWCDYRPASR